MTDYLDASVVVAAYTAESNSVLSRRFIAERTAGTVVASWWTYAEAASAVGRRTRAGELRADIAPLLLMRLRDALIAGFSLAVPVLQDFEFAAALLGRSDAPLRAGDALHLAIAARLGATAWTFDRRMAEAGQALGLGTRLLA